MLCLIVWIAFKNKRLGEAPPQVGPGRECFEGMQAGDPSVRFREGPKLADGGELPLTQRTKKVQVVVPSPGAPFGINLALSVLPEVDEDLILEVQRHGRSVGRRCHGQSTDPSERILGRRQGVVFG